MWKVSYWQIIFASSTNNPSIDVTTIQLKWKIGIKRIMLYYGVEKPKIQYKQFLITYWHFICWVNFLLILIITCHKLFKDLIFNDNAMWFFYSTKKQLFSIIEKSDNQLKIRNMHRKHSLSLKHKTHWLLM